MSIKTYIPSMTEAVKIAVVTVLLAVTGIGAMLISKVQSFRK